MGESCQSRSLSRNISSSICQKPEMKLSKGSYFHSSFACMASRSNVLVNISENSGCVFALFQTAGLKCWASSHFFLPFQGLWSKGNIWELILFRFWLFGMRVKVWGIFQYPWPLVWSPVRHWIIATFAAIRVISGRERWRPTDHTSARKSPCTTAVLFHESLLQESNSWV